MALDEKARRLRAHVARLDVLVHMLEEQRKRSTSSVSNAYKYDFEDIVEQIGKLLNEDFSFLAKNIANFGGPGDVTVESLALRVRQADSFLKEACAKELGLEQINITLDSMKDPILRDRCNDLLRAHDHYDRAVNQATLVLEDRLRKKTDKFPGLTGAQLVNALVKAEPDKSPIVLSSDPGEQKGFSDIMRGIMAAHRNPTHHAIHDMSQLDAARICSYIDVLLEIVDAGQINASAVDDGKS